MPQLLRRSHPSTTLSCTVTAPFPTPQRPDSDATEAPGDIPIEGFVFDTSSLLRFTPEATAALVRTLAGRLFVGPAVIGELDGLLAGERLKEGRETSKAACGNAVRDAIRRRQIRELVPQRTDRQVAERLRHVMQMADPNKSHRGESEGIALTASSGLAFVSRDADARAVARRVGVTVVDEVHLLNAVFRHVAPNVGEAALRQLVDRSRRPFGYPAVKHGWREAIARTPVVLDPNGVRLVPYDGYHMFPGEDPANLHPDRAAVLDQLAAYFDGARSMPDLGEATAAVASAPMPARPAPTKRLPATVDLTHADPRRPLPSMDLAKPLALLTNRDDRKKLDDMTSNLRENFGVDMGQEEVALRMVALGVRSLASKPREQMPSTDRALDGWDCLRRTCEPHPEVAAAIGRLASLYGQVVGGNGFAARVANVALRAGLDRAAAVPQLATSERLLQPDDYVQFAANGDPSVLAQIASARASLAPDPLDPARTTMRAASKLTARRRRVIGPSAGAVQAPSTLTAALDHLRATVQRKLEITDRAAIAERDLPRVLQELEALPSWLQAEAAQQEIDFERIAALAARGEELTARIATCTEELADVRSLSRMDREQGMWIAAADRLAAIEGTSLDVALDSVLASAPAAEQAAMRELFDGVSPIRESRAAAQADAVAPVARRPHTRNSNGFQL